MHLLDDFYVILDLNSNKKPKTHLWIGSDLYLIKGMGVDNGFFVCHYEHVAKHASKVVI